MDKTTILLLISVVLFIVACTLAFRSSERFQQLKVIAPAKTECDDPQANYPTKPRINSVTITKDGIVVDFGTVGGTPEISSYIVSSGQGNPSIIVASPTKPNTVSLKATLPVMIGQSGAKVGVQSVNSYGISDPVFHTTIFTKADLSKVTANPNIKVIQLIQLSDFHGAVETTDSNPGIGKLSTSFNQDRNLVPTTFTFSSGDNFGASPLISSQFEEVPTVLGMNKLKFDVSTFGNHEHDRPFDHLKRMIDLSDFQWVVSNYDTVRPITSERKPVNEFTIISRNGFNIGVVGGNTYDLNTFKKENLNYKDRDGTIKTLTISQGAKEINSNIMAAKAAGADIVVVLIHQGHLSSIGGCAKGPLIELSKAIKGAAVIFGGHTHQIYNTIIPGQKWTLLGQVWSGGLAYNRVSLTYNSKEKQVVGSFLEVVKFDDIKKLAVDLSTQELINNYKALLGSQFDVKIGKIDGVFPRGGQPPVERSGETPMGNLIADLMRQRTGTDFALTNGGGIRDTFPAKTYKPKDTTLSRPGISPAPFDLVMGDAYSVLPFGNSIVKVNITGTLLWKLLENGVSAWPGHGKFPQISGFNFTFDPTKPVNSRIISVTKLDGTPITKDDLSTYTLTTNNFIFDGGDGYAGIDRVSSEFPGDLLLDLLITKVKSDAEQGIVTSVPKVEGRIVKV